jgi:TonB family protein
MDAVTPILVDRSREPQGLRTMIALSLVAHALLMVAILVMPRPGIRDTAPREVMTISLGGAPGPRNGGMTPMSGAPREAASEPKPVPAAPPAPKPPEMVMPRKDAKPPKAVSKSAPDNAHGRTVAKAVEATTGDARVDTGAKGPGFGLTTGGGGTGGYLDVANFCCPEYLGTMLQLIQRNWSSKQQVPGETLVKFTIQRDGRLTDIQLERSSGYFVLDQTAQRALVVTRQLPPLPTAFTEPTLTVHLIFRYES